MKLSLRAARTNIGYTQGEAAKKLGINHDTLVRYEKNSSKIGRDIIEKMEELYFIDANYIFLVMSPSFIGLEGIQEMKN
ncbi:helix-turn-helix domain-containing protein [Mammaliicoccus sciuri]|nr:helix-turn-helix domain-containing protein [Mammaliicoccus sciuri]